MALRELLLKLGVDVDPAGVKKADDALGKIKKAAVAAAVAFAAIKAVKGIGSLVDGVRAIGDELDKTSQQIGISVAALEELRFAADLSGVGANEFSNSLGRLQKNAFEASKGNKTLIDDFKLLGIKVEDLNGNLKSGEQLFMEFADGIKNIENPTKKTGLAMNLMGRTGKQLLPLFVDGAAGIKKMREEARSLGFIMGKDLIDATVKLTDDQLRAQKAWEGIKNVIAEKLIPVFIKFSNLSVKVAKAIKGPLKKAFDIIEGAIGVVVNIVETMIGIFGELDNVYDQVTVSLGLLGIALVLLGNEAVVAGFKMFVAGIKAAASWILAALPFILIAALIAILLLAIDDFITFMKGGDSVIGRLIDRFKKWVDEMGGVGGAIKAIFIKVFQEIFGFSEEKAKAIVQAFVNAKEAISETFDDLSEGLSEVFLFIEKLIIGFKDGMVAAIDFVINKFDALTDVVADAIGAVAEFVGLGEKDQVDRGEFRRQTRDRIKASRDAISGLKKQAAVIAKAASEGFGTAVIKRDESGKIISAGLTGARAGAGERLAQLRQNINAPLTINVDASGQTNPDAIARSIVSGAAPKIQSNRQTALGFQTEPVR